LCSHERRAPSGRRIIVITVRLSVSDRQPCQGTPPVNRSDHYLTGSALDAPILGPGQLLLPSPALILASLLFFSLSSQGSQGRYKRSCGAVVLVTLCNTNGEEDMIDSSA